jgi:hypothetical protein
MKKWQFRIGLKRHLTSISRREIFQGSSLTIPSPQQLTPNYGTSCRETLATIRALLT